MCSSDLRVGWHFIPKAERKGLQIKEMTEPQRKAAHALLRSTLSQVGYDKATQIMQLEQILHELEEAKGTRRFARDPQRYYFTIFGTPGPTERWGLSIEGHHLSLNFVVAEDRKSTRLNSSHVVISYAVFCLKKKNTPTPPRSRPPTSSFRSTPL